MLHENALAPQTQIGFLWLLCWASLVINCGGCTTFPSQLAFMFLGRCGWFFFFFSFLVLGPTGQWLFSALSKTNTPRSAATMTTCRNRVTHNTHTRPRNVEGGFLLGQGQGMISKA